MSEQRQGVRKSEKRQSVSMSEQRQSVRMSEKRQCKHVWRDSVSMSEQRQSVRMSEQRQSVRKSEKRQNVSMSEQRQSVRMSEQRQSVSMSDQRQSVSMSEHIQLDFMWILIIHTTRTFPQLNVWLEVILPAYVYQVSYFSVFENSNLESYKNVKFCIQSFLDENKNYLYIKIQCNNQRAFPMKGLGCW